MTTLPVADLEARLAQETGATPARVDVLNALAWELRAADTARALAMSQEANKLARRIAYGRGLGYSLLYAGICHVRLADREAALPCLQEALFLLAGVDQRGEAMALNALGNVEYMAGNLVEALAYYIRSLDGRQRSGDRRGEAVTLMNIGNIYEKLGDYANALDYFFRNLGIAQEIDDEHARAVSMANIGVVYQNTGDPEKAAESFAEGAQIFRRVGDRQGEAACLNNLGFMYQQQGEHERALEYFLRAHQISGESGDRVNQAMTATNAGEVYALLGDDEAALDCLQRGLTIAREIGNPQVETAAIWSLGGFLLDKRQFDQAIEQLGQGLAVAERIGYREWIYKTHESLAEAYEQAGQMGSALEHYRAFHRVKEEVFNEESGRKTKTLMAQFQVEKAQREAEIYRLRNVELAQAHTELQALNQSLQAANAQIRHQAELLEQQTREDSLTGLYNRRYLDQQLALEFQRARRFGRPLAVVMADLDHFKRINDRYSHAMGDRVLQAVADILRQSCRETDFAARYGGEEFVLFLPETSAVDGAVICERIRQTVEAYDWAAIQPGLHVTISMGLAENEGHADHGALLRAADDRLYEAKRAGRNRVQGCATWIG
ncbi:MAG: GGDEF domain-containing protein [Chloroflexi bacterium]|nr:GGDEF domain-containing protein [Chloroflexota bacterium]MBU1747713.1 GGDEF domain-containing protein [Chloroflexota bacterium]